MADEVVISGVGAHFPECDNLKEYREKLLQNLHLISDTAGELQPRYDGTAVRVEGALAKENLKSGKMRYGNKFDNTFFGMHSRLAAATDSITRHVLESTLEAILDAGYSPKDLHGTNTAVFMGYHCSESESNFIRESADGFGIMGLNAAMTANRVSYWLDLKGTSFTHNTQLVSGMQGMDMAFRAISRGECDRALVGAASLSYLAELAVHYVDLGWLSASGTCKPFDKAADGGVRSEAVVVLLLERRSSAQRVYAEVVHTASSFFAEMSRTELPHLERRVVSSLLTSFYTECGVHPDDLEYLEADGWGVDNIDEAELGAIDDAIASRRTRPLCIGSVKGNIGQVEAASGLASICKVLVALETGTIPATINHVHANPVITALQRGRIQVVTENRPLKDGLVAVNNLGLGGLVGHVLLRPSSRIKPTPPPKPAESPEATSPADPVPKLLLISGRTPEGLEEVIKRAEESAHDPEYVHLVHGAFSSHIFGHMYRGYTVVPKGEVAPQQVKFYTGQKRPVWFIYSGMGSQWPGMGVDLMRIPVFAAAIERCHKALAPLGLDLKHIITTKDPTIYDNILHSFVGIAAVQVALTDVLHEVGLVPDGIIGHSVGELGCAYADGCITAEQMILAAHARGQASNETELIPGMMAAVGMGYKDIKDMVPESIEVACHNSATSCTLSGPTEDMNAYVAELKAKNIFARGVNVANIAYHSRYIRPAAPRLLELLKGVILEPKMRSSRWISTSTKPSTTSSDSSHASAEYFTNNLLSSVFFEEGSEQIPEDALAIEIAPHGLLQAILKRSLHADAVNVALTKRDSPGTAMVLDALGKMYMEGLNPQISRLYPPVETPVSRGTTALSPLATWDHRDSWPVAFLKAPAESGPRTEANLELSLNDPELEHLSGYTWNGYTLLSPATCLALVYNLVKSYVSDGSPIVLDNVVFPDYAVIEDESSEELYAFVQRGSGHFEVSASGRLLVSGQAHAVHEAEKDRALIDRPMPSAPREERVVLDAETVYEELGRRGLSITGNFRTLLQVQQGQRTVLAQAVDLPEVGLQLETIIQVIMLQCSEGHHELHRVERIQRIVFHHNDPLPADSEATLLLDAAHRSVHLASSVGRVDVSLVETCALPLSPQFAPILVQAKSFVPFGGAVKDLPHLASLSLQVAALQGRLPLMVAAVQDPQAARSALVNTLLQTAEQQLPDLRVRLTTSRAGSDSASMLVSSAPELPAALQALRRQRGLLLAELPPDARVPAGLHELLHVVQGSTRYVLLKHAVDVDTASETLLAESDSDLPLERLALCQGAVVFVVLRGVALQRVPAVLRSVFAAPGGNRAHCLLLDAAAPPFNLDAEPYASQLRLGLRANVLQEGRWGGVYRLHLAHLSAGSPGCESVARHRQLAMPGMQVQFLGVNPHADGGEDSRSAVALLDYTALRPDGQRVMGVCSSGAGPLQADPVLAWSVPPTWSDEDASTVPLAYATAMYALHHQMEMRAGETALVVGGGTPLGQAAVALLLSKGCSVITTAANERERAELRSRLPGIDVVLGPAEQFCQELQRRSGGPKCVDLALVQGGANELRCVMSILNKYGRASHVGADHSVMSQALGLSSFLLSTSCYSVSWSWPLRARSDAKTQVRDELLKAIQQGEVRPLPRQTAPPQALAESQRRVTEGAGKVLLSFKSEQPISAGAASLLDPGRSCLVVGGPAARAVSVSEWMLSSGARDVSVALAGRAAGSGWLARRLGLLAAHYGASVRALPAADLQQLVRALPLGLVMVLEQQPGRVRAVDVATRSTGCTLVVLAAQAAQPRELMELGSVVRCRREHGYPAVLATFGDIGADARVFPLQQVLRAAINPAVDSVDVLQIAPNDDFNLSDSGIAALPNLMPTSLEALRRLGLSLADTVTQRVLPSLIGGPVDRRNKEVPPVFLVGGLSDSANRELGPIAHYLMATAVVVAPPQAASSVEEAAAAVVAAMVRAQPRGPYTLVGRGWGGCVALEAGRSVSKRQDCYVTVFLLDAAPDALQAAVQPLHNQPNGLQTALLKYLLKLDRETEEQVYRAPDWSARLERALSARDTLLEGALTCVLRRVQSLLDYQMTGPVNPKLAVTLLSSHGYHLQAGMLSEMAAEIRVHRLQPVEQFGLAAACKQCANVISSGVHVGLTNMMERRALASLNVTF